MSGGPLPAWLAESRLWAERVLAASVPGADTSPERLHRAMRHALFGGGKRLRPALVRFFCRELGGADEDAALPAAAVELVHTYSLVHDDLPAMDDDDLRRGRPTVHVAFDEATAILAGDALLTLAFELVGQVGGVRGSELARVLARAAGSRGMVGGQVLDLSLEQEQASGDGALAGMHALKTAALFAAACEMGAIAAGASGPRRVRAAEFGHALGLLFQATDDLLDVTGDERTLGKTPGKDVALARATLVSTLGLERARERAAELADQARAATAALPAGGRARALELVGFVHERRA